jgi:hypothetical protein
MSDSPSSPLHLLLSFLRQHPEYETLTAEDIAWLFRIPSLADILDRVLPLILVGDECVLGRDELRVYENLSQEDVQKDVPELLLDEDDVRYSVRTIAAYGRREIGNMDKQRELLREHINSMKRRVEAFEKFVGTTSSDNSDGLQKINVRIEKAYEQVCHRIPLIAVTRRTAGISRRPQKRIILNGVGRVAMDIQRLEVPYRGILHRRRPPLHTGHTRQRPTIIYRRRQRHIGSRHPKRTVVPPLLHLT